MENNTESPLQKGIEAFESGNKKRYKEKKGNFFQITPHKDEGNDYWLAFEYFFQANKDSPDDKAILAYLGRACLELEKYNDAIKHFTEVIQNNPEDVNAYVYKALTYFRMAETQSRGSSLKEAFASLRFAVALDSEDSFAREAFISTVKDLNNRNCSYFQKIMAKNKDDFYQIIDDYYNAKIKTDSENVGLYKEHANFYKELRDNDKAIDCLKEENIRDCKNKYDLYLELSKLYLRGEDMSGDGMDSFHDYSFINDSQKTTKKEEHKTEADFGQAINALMKAVELNPLESGLCIKLANLYIKNHQCEEAIKFLGESVITFKEAIAKKECDDLQTFRLGLLYNKRAGIYGKNGDYKKAIEDYREGIKQAPGATHIYNNLISLYENLAIKTEDKTQKKSYYQKIREVLNQEISNKEATKEFYECGFEDMLSTFSTSTEKEIELTEDAKSKEELRQEIEKFKSVINVKTETIGDRFMGM